MKFGLARMKVASGFRVISLLTLIIAGLTGPSTASTLSAAPGHKLIDPGIKTDVQSFCWYDNERLVFLLRESQPKESVFRGLYYLDIRKPTEHHRINLAPISESDQRPLINVYCQDKTILFSLGSSSKDHPDRRRLYSLEIGKPSELIAEARGLIHARNSVNLEAKYVIANSRRILMDGPQKGAFDGHDDCSVAYLKPGFKVLCWDTWLVTNWPLRNFVVAGYRWEDRINVKGDDGKKKHVPNPEPQLLKTGKSFETTIFLKDFNKKNLVNFKDDNSQYVIAVSAGLGDWFHFQVSPDEKYAYALCKRRDDAEAMRYSQFTGVCRYLIDGAVHKWEPVFFLPPRGGKPAHVQWPTGGVNGDIYVWVMYGRNPAAIWKYSAATKKAEQITQPPAHGGDDAPQSSPDGKRVVFKRSHQGVKTIFIVETN